MNENHTITLQDKKWGMPVRVLTLITFFLGAFTLVQAILLLSEYYSNYDVSMPVVILFLLITPFAFVAALMFAFGVHKIAQGNGADKNIILGFAMMPFWWSCLSAAAVFADNSLCPSRSRVPSTSKNAILIIIHLPVLMLV